jgi:pimeloyl-ACP methyl ester carboxylesterase
MVDNRNLEPELLHFEVVYDGQRLRQTGWLFLPTAQDPRLAKTLLLCHPGGSYSKSYFHLEVPGYPGYSFAAWFAARGASVIALDNIAVGQSDVPSSCERLGLIEMARTNAQVSSEIRRRLAAGMLHPELHPRDRIVGIGHSLGAALTCLEQSTAASYDTVALLGWTQDRVAGFAEPMKFDPRSTEAFEITRQKLSNALGGPEVWNHELVKLPRDKMRDFFHGNDVPTAIMDADDARATIVPRLASIQALTPGYTRDAAAKINCPIFLGGTASDVSPAPRLEPSFYSLSNDITTYIMPGSGHCHNFSKYREELWQRILSWLRCIPALK